jgi:hypothetical protein
MKLTLSFAALTAAVVSANPFAPSKSSNTAKAKYMNTLVGKAHPTANSQLRRLDQNQQQEGEEYIPDISYYSLKFQQCQFVKSYDDDLAGDEDSSTVLATKRFVVFRLCPSDACESCSSNFGEYLVDLETYLQSTVEYQQAIQEEMCRACQECGNWENQQQANEQNGEEQQNDAGRRLQNVDCDSFYDECMKIENMEANGYIDATNFMECQMIYDPEDDGKAALFAGPMCASGGTKIKVGVFEDEECNIPDLEKDVDDYLMDGDGLSMKLSHALLKTVYSSDCISCLWVDENDENENQEQQNDDQQNQNNNRDANENKILDMCEELYEDAAKCEKANGFDNGYANYWAYENQLSQEGVVCDFIASLKAGSYDETGEIVVWGANSALGGGAKTTGGQKFALTFFMSTLRCGTAMKGAAKDHIDS